ncbi:serine hydrolase [Lentilactobacillus curieae]|uniref:Serine hydrolase n=1 Tax=Lentilactobacillus curieae TaxID=1138822 RepID=A0A1S6QL19_9LACO|nr:serine hydrolase domain-containing protein [Lentilactobacillus curieae]AQW22273.1 serine hydrolase [Lentilactobacillus curieae]
MNFSKTIAKIEDGVHKGIVPGASYSIIDGTDQIDEHLGFQELTPERQLLQDNETYDLASLTKVVGTTNVILQLINEHKINVDDSISKYLPEWKSPEVTIRNLLTHTSDIVGYIPHRNELPKNQLIKAELGLSSGDKRSQVLRYQDTNFLFLGWIASKILGKPIHQLIKERVLEPLGLTETTFAPRDISRVVPTQIVPGKGLLRGTVHDPKTQVLQEDSGAAGLFSTQLDLAKFLRFILGENRELTRAVLSDECLGSLFVDQTPTQIGIRSFGWVLTKYDDQPIILHTGYTGTLLIVDRHNHRGLVYLSNRVHPQVNGEPFLKYRSELIHTFMAESNK